MLFSNLLGYLLASWYSNSPGVSVDLLFCRVYTIPDSHTHKKQLQSYFYGDSHVRCKLSYLSLSPSKCSFTAPNGHRAMVSLPVIQTESLHTQFCLTSEDQTGCVQRRRASQFKYFPKHNSILTNDSLQSTIAEVSDKTNLPFAHEFR